MEERKDQAQQPQAPYGIPKDIFLPSSSRSSITSSSVHLSNNDCGIDYSVVEGATQNSRNDRLQEDASSVWSLSTTSELTFHSHGEIPALPMATQTVPTTEVQLAVESTYQDLEGVATAFGPSFTAENAVQNLDSFPVVADAVQDHVDDGVAGEEDEPLFDPFMIQTEDVTATFVEFYNTPALSSENQDENKCITNVNDSGATSLDSQGESLLINHCDAFADEALSATEKSCTPSLRRLDKQQRGHSDVGLGSSAKTDRRKRRVLIPLHARMEMITYQSRKPFRTVSRMITGSIHRLHDRMTRPMAPKRIASLPPKNRFEIFRRNSELIVTQDYQYEESSTSSLPDLRNVDSSETEVTPPIQLETEQTFTWEKDETGNEEADQCIAQFMLDEEPRAKVATDPVSGAGRMEEQTMANAVVNEVHRTALTPNASHDEDEDLRWLFARQQLPACVSFEREEEEKSFDPDGMQTQVSI
jgi:hypothetical protein